MSLLRASDRRLIPHRSTQSSSSSLAGRLGEDVVDQAEVLRFFGGEVVVAVTRLEDLVGGFAGVAGEDLVEGLAGLDDLVGLDLDVGDLAADAAVRLVDHHLAVLQREPLALLARRPAGPLPPLAARPTQ